MRKEQIIRTLKRSLYRIQSKLEFDDWRGYPQFATKNGLGRTALLSCILSFLAGIHCILFLFFTSHIFNIQLIFQNGDCFWGNTYRIQLLWSWCFYVVFMCIFHLLEFFTTVIYNPSIVSSNSFLINHSISYTIAAIFSWIEFFLKFIFVPYIFDTTTTTTIIAETEEEETTTSSSSSSSLSFLPYRIYISIFGMCIVICSQYIRSIAMITCGESFNHLIQQSKKENHKLITYGIYKILRHPSYVGFFYWSIGMQFVLTNYISIICFTIASWNFFNRRIPYEEECLYVLFPNEYPNYQQSTYIGIPFISTTTSTFNPTMMASSSQQQLPLQPTTESILRTTPSNNNNNNNTTTSNSSSSSSSSSPDSSPESSTTSSSSEVYSHSLKED